MLTFILCLQNFVTSSYIWNASRRMRERTRAHAHTRIKYFKPRFIMLENFWRQYFASILHELSYFGEILHELRKAVCKVRAGKVCRIKKPWSKIFNEKCLKKSCYLSMPMRKLFQSPPKPTYTDSYNFTLNKKSNCLIKYIKNRTQNLSLSHTHTHIYRSWWWPCQGWKWVFFFKVFTASEVVI